MHRSTAVLARATQKTRQIFSSDWNKMPPRSSQPYGSVWCLSCPQTDLKKPNSTAALENTAGPSRPSRGTSISNCDRSSHRRKPVRSLDGWPGWKPGVPQGLLQFRQIPDPGVGLIPEINAVLDLVITPSKKKHMPVVRWVVRCWNAPIHQS